MNLQPGMKYLKQAGTGRIYPWRPALANRPDMVPHPPAATQKMVDGGDAKMMQMDYERVRYFISTDSAADFNALCQDHRELKEVNAKLALQLSEQPKETVTAETATEELVSPLEGPAEADEPGPAPVPEMSLADREKAIYDAIVAVVKEGDLTKFGPEGVPSMSALEEACGFALSVEEREIQWESFKSSQV